MVDNRSPYTHAWFRKRGPGTRDFDVLVAQATYSIDVARQRLEFEPGVGLQAGDELDGDPSEQPLASTLVREGSLLLYKPATDIHVIGTAQAPEGRAVPSWLAGVRVGDCEKLVKLCGPRYFQLRLLGWSLNEPEPVSDLSLSYRLSFGGHFASEVDASIYLSKADNPAGRGWLPKPEHLRELPRSSRDEMEARVYGVTQLPAPQIEDPRSPTRSPEQDLPTIGLGPIARWWKPRVDRLGTRDEAWRNQPSAGYPKDFDPAFFQSAAAGLTASGYLRGGEAVVLGGLFAEGQVRFSLPEDQPIAVVVRNDASQQIAPLVLDTVQIDLDARRLQLTWRTSFMRTNPVRHLTLVKDGRA